MTLHGIRWNRVIRFRLRLKDPAAILFTGLLLRELFSFWTGHPYDSEVWLRNAFYVSRGISPYSFMDPIPGLSFSFLDQTLPSVGYPPLWSLMLAGLYRLFILLPTDNRFVLYFLLKQPTILGDVFLGYVLYRAILQWGGTSESAGKILRFWMLFPYAILISAIWGQFDALVAFIWIASLLTVRPIKRSALDGLAILLKLFPLIFVPYHVLRDRGTGKLRQIITLGIPVGFTAAAFYLGGWGFEDFRGTIVYGARGVPLGMTIIGVLFSSYILDLFPGIVSAFAVVAWVWVPATVGAGFYASRRFSRDSRSGLIQALLFVTVVFFLFRAQVYEQYLLYLLPLLLVDVVLWHPQRIALFHATWVIGLIYLLFNNDFLIRFVVPVFPAAQDYTYGLDNNSSFGPVRGVILLAVAVIFAVHLVQMALVLIDERRSTTPWVYQALRQLVFSRRRHVVPESHQVEGPAR